MFKKNLEALRKIQAPLARQLEETQITDRTTLFLSGPHEDINIAYDNIALHTMEDPLGEALTVFEAEVPESHRNYQCITFIFGMGMGYLLRRTFIHTEGQIIIYEPYPEVLRQVLEVVDFTQEFESKRVTIITHPDQVGTALNGEYYMGDAFKIFALPSYRVKEGELFLKILDEVKAAMYVSIVAQNTTLQMMEEFTRSSLENLSRFLRYPEPAFLHNQLAGKPGVVISAGPSLDRPGVLEALKAHRDNVVISCVGQAAKVLDKAGITPDFVNILEIKDVSQQVSGVSFLGETNLILLPQTNEKIFDLPSKRKLISHTMRDPLTTWLSRALGVDLFGYNHQGTVSITALVHLIKMGCNPIYLLGQDLAYPEGQMYAQNSVYKGCRITLDEAGKKKVEWENRSDFYGIKGFAPNEEEWQRRAKSCNDRITEVKGWHGEKLMTSITYAAYIKTFETMQIHHPKFNLVNCSEGGAFINGLEHLPFTEALEKYKTRNFHAKADLENLMAKNYEEAEPYSTLYQKVYDQYILDRQELEHLQQITENGLDIVKDALQEINRKKTISKALKKHLGKLSTIDEELSQLTSNNVLINCYIKPELLKYSRTYARKMDLKSVEGEEETGLEAYRENLETTRDLYKAVAKGAMGLAKTLDPIFEDFPAEKKGPAPEPLASQPQNAVSSPAKT